MVYLVKKCLHQELDDERRMIRRVTGECEIGSALVDNPAIFSVNTAYVGIKITSRNQAMPSKLIYFSREARTLPK